MENDNQKTSTIINDALPFEPSCPHCLKPIDIEKDVPIPDERPQEKDPSPTKVLMEIAHSSETMMKAYDLVSQAYDLINKDKVARQYIHFHSEVKWHKFVWDILMSQYNKDNPLSDDIYHLRAFDYYGIQPGMYVTDGCVDGQG